MKTLKVRFEDLPQVVQIVRRDGTTKNYQLKPAGKDKFGACLAGLESALVEKLLRDRAK